METLLLTLVLILIVAVAGLAFAISRLKVPSDQTSLQIRLDAMNEMLNQNLQKTLEASQKQHHHTSGIIQTITERLTTLDETNKQVLGFSEQLQSLENVLKNPKHRGVLGEYYLENVLKNVLPPDHYQMQYGFSDGDIVDAVVFVKDKIIPIDSKFSLENYNRIIEEKDPSQQEALQRDFKNGLKKRFDETSKYIKPNEGTMDFAFMFIPAEGIYYDLLINKVGALKVNTHDLIEYAFSQKHVIIVSPTSFFAYLQTVLQGLRALQIEESAKEIRQHVGQLNRHLISYEDYLKKMGNHLGTTVNMFNSSYKEFKKIDKDVVKITAGESGGGVEAFEVPKTLLEE